MFWRRSAKKKLKRLERAMAEFLIDFDGEIWTETAADGTKIIKIWHVTRRDKRSGKGEIGQIVIFDEKNDR